MTLRLVTENAIDKLNWKDGYEMPKQGCSDRIRKATRLVVERDGEFLVSATGAFLRWSISPYDAWSTRDRTLAYMVTWKTRGRLFLFNPVVGEIKPIGASK